MRRYILKRIIYGIGTLIGVTIIVFVLSRFSGDVVLLLAPSGASDEQLQEIRTRFGLDKPIPVQYLVFIKNALQGDFGNSIIYNQPVMKLVADRLPATLKLAGITYILSNICGILMGIFLATRPRPWIDQSSKIFVLLGQAIPNFWLALMLMLVFAVNLHWLPTSGMGGFKYYVLPVVSMFWFEVAFLMRQVRSSILDVMDMEYIKMARIKGNPERVVILKHALKNALIPVVTMMTMQIPMVLGGQVFIETIFRWPGVGLLMFGAITGRDYPLTQAVVIVVATATILAMLIKDLLYVAVDPRIKFE